MMKTLNLNTLDVARAQVEFNGATYPLRSITVRIASMLEAASEAEGAAKMTAYLDVVAALVPTMPRAELENLTVPQLLGVVTLASEPAAEVESAAGSAAIGDPVSDPNGTSSAPTAAAPSDDAPAPAAT